MTTGLTEVHPVLVGRLSGFWRADHTVEDAEGNTVSTGTHYLQLQHKSSRIADSELIAESIPEFTKAFLIAQFWIYGNVAKGAWWDASNGSVIPGGILPGGTRLIISADEKNMSGKWVALEDEVNTLTGRWDFFHLGNDVTAIEESR
jgi:hypothetical protein